MNQPAKPHWRTVTVFHNATGQRIKTMSALVGGRRLWMQETWDAPDAPGGDHRLLDDLTRYWYDGGERLYRTLDVMLREATEPTAA